MLGSRAGDHLWITCESAPASVKNGRKMEKHGRDHSAKSDRDSRFQTLWSNCLFTVRAGLVKCRWDMHLPEKGTK